MTRKDYQLIAGALAAARPRIEVTESGHPAGQYAQWLVDVRRIVEALASDNPRFDRNRFLEAIES